MCSVRVVSLKTTVEKTRYGVRNVSDGLTHVVLVWRKILFVSLVRDKHCFVLSLYPFYLYFLCFVTITLLSVKFIHLSKLGALTSQNYEHVCA